ncbi:MAG: DUF190 domain-containing protein [Myxococcota bacterium]
METFPRKRIDVVVEEPALRRLQDALKSAGAIGWSVLAVHSGFGRSGDWDASGSVTATSSMSLVTLVVDEGRLDSILKAVSGVLNRHIGIVTVSDCQVLRPERFK